MVHNGVVFSIFLIFSGAAVLSTVALYTRQSLLVAYIILGFVLGPWGLKLISDASVVHKVDDIGIIFLLFLLGLNLRPQDLLHMFKKTFVITLISSMIFFMVSFVVGYVFHFSITESIIIGGAMTFSSTIIGLKLLPTTVLHHQHTGELVISILLIQDLLAILILLFLHVSGTSNFGWTNVSLAILSLPILFITAFLFVKFILMKLFAKFDRLHEYIFLLAIAWCLSLSELAHVIGLPYEIGAFIAGIAIAASPISVYIAESLKPIRDFFLVLFFFSMGANFNLHYLPTIIVPAAILAGLLIIIKPLTFRLLLPIVHETKHVSWEIGVRLGQASSFSLLVAYTAANEHLISAQASYLIQATTVVTFIVSSYIVILLYPTPISVSEELRRD